MAICRICSASTVFWATANGFRVDRCPQCGFGQVDISPEILNSFYDSDYFAGRKAKFAQHENTMISVSHRCWIEWQLAKTVRSGPLRVLEIGPGIGGPIAGYFQHERKDDTYAAVELSEFAANRLRKRGVHVWTGRITDPAIINACRGNYDFVFGMEVIEHDLDPHGFLQAVHEALRRGGRAAFTTGNLDGWMSKWHKADWYYLDPPAHVSFFTPKSAHKAMEDAGFKKFDVKRYGFRHMKVVAKYPSHIRSMLLWGTHVANISTGMTISAERG